MSKPRFCRVVREAWAAARDEAAELGAEVSDLTVGRKHPQTEVRFRGQWRRLTFSGSPRSGGDNALDWARQSVRRAVREMQDG